MSVIKVGNGYYFMYIGIAAAYILALSFILRGRSLKCKRAVLLVILFANFSLHFLKLAFPPYVNDLPHSIKRSTMENICAVSTVFFPFIFLIKKHNVLHDFMYFIGFCGGLAALCFPTEAINKPPFAFDTVRFYFCHINLLAAPLLAAISGVYRPRLKSFWAIPLLFLLWETIICLDEFCLMWAGVIKGEFTDFFNPAFSNSSFQFGVAPSFAWAAKILDPFVPPFFKTDAFGLNGGKDFYFPVLWLIGPAFVYLIPVYIIISSPFFLAERLKRRDSTAN